ncbi:MULTISPECIES: EAL domain-containing protein [unclassified Rhodococcus (in: high G+C Gram-positive bacteria)]|uniref:putative bifunctional diguanylate cyclase/phosphodiesterase n=1 Tax=unclassified Rhodococcus (in: high G+C Gram-positive bacteria) TaxID=192944 RepID=UPI0011EF3F7C|nr:MULTISPECIES: EAL domain-containing protein [unclassified Rhodococcus (in: high G+C Gram-positive bacteria)]KAA0924331.1 EAL domain-containing protein [Rhodococcus sp. ANT_H53B]MDI9925835.1 EAL domain-containing protein [Rhodococcus sp. IEGM 1341]
MNTKVAAPFAMHTVRTVGLGAVVVVAGTVFVLGDAGVRAGVLATVAVGSVLAISAAIRRYRPDDSRCWWALFGASVLFMFGVSLRSDPTALNHSFPLLPDLFTLTGYALVGYALSRWIRDRRSIDDITPLVDAGLIFLGTLFLSWLLFISPALGSPRSSASTVFNGLYPAIDAALITLTTYLLFSSKPRTPALQWALVALVATLVGDISYAFAATTDDAPSSGLLDGIYLFAYLALAMAALDPSMRTVSQRQTPAPAHSSRRVVFVVTLLVVCATVPLLGSAVSTGDLIVRSLLLASILVGAFLRGERALTRVQVGEEHAKYLAAHDLLTGLPNRTMLDEEFTRLERTQTPGRTCVLFVDLDNFKMVNDSYGHRVGDELIVAAARRIRAAVGAADTVVRYAGDEFVVLTRRDRGGAEALARRIIDRTNEPFPLSAATAYVTASVGIADADRLHDAIREADTAMYHAKSLGAARYAFFDESLRARATSAIETATALRGAIRRGELEVYYQPIIETTSRTTVVYEALLRWNWQGRVRTPNEFIPIAESTNLIKEIGEWVLRTAMSDLVTLRSNGQDVTMSVNVSPMQLRDDSLPVIVARLLDTYGLDGADLALEITESVLIDDMGTAKSVLDRLAAMGVLIVLDDFGIGYSSLSRLRAMPIALLKIDKSFVHQIGTSESDTQLIRAIVAMASALPVATVAEGVETEEQAAIIEALECRFAQGFLFGRPAPVAHWLLESAETRAGR